MPPKHRHRRSAAVSAHDISLIHSFLPYSSSPPPPLPSLPSIYSKHSSVSNSSSNTFTNSSLLPKIASSLNCPSLVAGDTQSALSSTISCPSTTANLYLKEFVYPKNSRESPYLEESSSCCPSTRSRASSSSSRSSSRIHRTPLPQVIDPCHLNIRDYASVHSNINLSTHDTKLVPQSPPNPNRLQSPALPLCKIDSSPHCIKHAIPTSPLPVFQLVSSPPCTISQSYPPCDSRRISTMPLHHIDDNNDESDSMSTVCSDTLPDDDVNLDVEQTVTIISTPHGDIWDTSFPSADHLKPHDKLNVTPFPVPPVTLSSLDTKLHSKTSGLIDLDSALSPFIKKVSFNRTSESLSSHSRLRRYSNVPDKVIAWKAIRAGRKGGSFSFMSIVHEDNREDFTSFRLLEGENSIASPLQFDSTLKSSSITQPEQQSKTSGSTLDFSVTPVSGCNVTEGDSGSEIEMTKGLNGAPLNEAALDERGVIVCESNSDVSFPMKCMNESCKVDKNSIRDQYEKPYVGHDQDAVPDLQSMRNDESLSSCSTPIKCVEIQSNQTPACLKPAIDNKCFTLDATAVKIRADISDDMVNATEAMDDNHCKPLLQRKRQHVKTDGKPEHKQPAMRCNGVNKSGGDSRKSWGSLVFNGGRELMRAGITGWSRIIGHRRGGSVSEQSRDNEALEKLKSAADKRMSMIIPKIISPTLPDPPGKSLEHKASSASDNQQIGRILRNIAHR